MPSGLHVRFIRGRIEKPFENITQDESDEVAQGIGKGQDFGRHAALGLADGLALGPPFAPCPWRWTLTMVASTTAYYEAFRRGDPPAGLASARLVAEFKRVVDALADLPGIIADPARLRAMLRHLARNLHVGFLNDCFFEAATALCLRRTPEADRKAPVLSHCSPDRCPYSCLTRRHLPPWHASIAEGDAALRDPRLSAHQRTALEIEQTRKRNLIAPLLRTPP